VRFRVTHQLGYQLEGAAGAAWDGVACGEASGGKSAPRFFLPGRLPCGNCSLCRRGLAAACTTPLDAITSDLDHVRSTALELSDRFLTPLDEPPEVDRLPSELAAGAGLVALGIQAAATANLMPGDVAIWLGGGLLAQVGAQLTAARGARSFLIGGELSRTEESPLLTSCASPAEVQSRLRGEADAIGSAHQRSIRRVFVTRSDPATLRCTVLLADAGASLILIGRGPARLMADFELPAEARLSRVSGYHPDLVPEALALLRRGEVKTPAATPITSEPELGG
jgi:threonine dehydrogenase-like Zn-dependent dehydrogenase